MFWAGHDHFKYETPIREDMAAVFSEYPEIQRVILEENHGLAAASHLANRIRCADRQDLSETDIESEMAAVVEILANNIFVDYKTCLSPSLSEYDSPVYLISSESQAPEDPRGVISQALGLIEQTSFESVVNRTKEIALVSLGEEFFPNTNQSYTLQNIFMTLYMDLYESPLLVAESIVHEHAHMVFNNYIYGDQSYDDTTPLYYSPWKECLRPAFNFIHSLIAFSDVITFINEVSAFDLREVDRRYVDMKLSFERRNLLSVRDSVNNALALLPDRKLAERILTTVDALL